MTGFGAARIQSDTLTADWEIKSVNNRFLDVRFKLPSVLRSMEQDWEKLVRAKASRGRVEIILHLSADSTTLMAPKLNCGLAAAMLDQVAKLAQANGQVFTPDFNRLLGQSHLWQDDDQELDPGLAELLAKGLEDALDDWNRSRRDEGALLIKDLKERLDALQGFRAQLAELAPRIKEAKQTAMQEKIAKALADTGFEVAEDRVLTELALLADKLDVSEELTRLDAHLQRFGELLDQGGEVGKKLDFLLQETFREITTCGNKCQDADASRIAVDCKAELEKCREQVQNLE